jgi:hypothetical protein
MRVSFVGAALIGLALSLSPASAQQSVMKECGTQWQAAKAAGTTNGQSWPQFLKDCRARLASMGSTGGPAPAAPAAAPTAAPATGVKTASQCATRNTRRTRPRSGRPVRRSAISWRLAAPAPKPFCKALPPRPPLRLFSSKQARSSPCRSPPRQPRRLRLRLAARPRPERVNSPQRRKRKAGAPERPWFGSTSTRTSTTSPGRTTTATRSAVPTCVRPTLRQQATARRRTSGILRRLMESGAQPAARKSARLATFVG